jgi:ElaB/YqjD/DUF883 family membrane-anchored ribosome-binding protein
MPRSRTPQNTTANVRALKKDLQSLRNDFAQLAKHVEGTAGTAGNEILDDVKTRLENLSGAFDDVVASATARGQEAVESATEMGNDLLESAEDALQQRPLMTLAVAVGVGFVLSSFMRR